MAHGPPGIGIGFPDSARTIHVLNMASFNSGEYQEISISTVLATQPAYLLATNFHLSEEVIEDLPKKQEFITAGVASG